MYETFEELFKIVVRYSILALEIVGATIIVVEAVRALISLLRDPHRSKTLLAEGINTALSFLLGSEVLKTIIAPDWRALGMTCAILLMRAAMTVLLHWEKKTEEKEALKRERATPRAERERT